MNSKTQKVPPPTKFPRGRISSYANAAKSQVSLPFEHAILMDQLQNASFEEHVTAMSQVMDPSQILRIGELQFGRLLFWIKDKQIALNSVGKCVIVAQQEVYIRPYVHLNKKITFSNCFPHVDDEYLERELAEKGIELKSPITHLKYSFSDPRFAHILSHKRQSFVAVEDVEKFPIRITTKVFDKEIIVFITSEGTMCYECKQEGHIAKNCPSKKSPSTHSQPGHLSPPESSPMETSPFDMIYDPLLIDSSPSFKIPASVAPEKSSTDDLVDLGAVRKRPISPSTSSDSNNAAIPDQSLEEISDAESNISAPSTASQSTQGISRKNPKMKKNPPKKAKKDSDGSEPEWSQLESVFENADPPLDLTFDQTRDLLMNSQDPNTIVENSQKLAVDKKQMYCMFDYIHSCLPGSSDLKTYISKVKQTFSDFDIPISKDTETLNLNPQAKDEHILHLDIDWGRIQQKAETYYPPRHGKSYSLDFSMIPTLMNLSTDQRLDALKKISPEDQQELPSVLEEVYRRSPDKLKRPICDLKQLVNEQNRMRRLTQFQK